MNQLIETIHKQYGFQPQWGTRWTSNTKGWVSPSGPIGKCNSDAVFESCGFGFEEWNMNPAQFSINGEHLGYVEANNDGLPPHEDERGHYHPNVIFWSRFCAHDKAVHPGPAILCNQRLVNSWHAVAIADKVYQDKPIQPSQWNDSFKSIRHADLTALNWPNMIDGFDDESMNPGKPGSSWMINSKFENLRILDCPIGFTPRHGLYRFRWYEL